MAGRIAGAILVGLALTSAACTTVVVPPAEPHAPQPVFLLDHGRHSSLVLPGEAGGLVRYSYGDWTYYALGRAGPLEATAAVLWPTRAGLGRRELPGPPTPEGVRRAVLVGIEHAYELIVASRDVGRLRASLDAIYLANRHTLVYNPGNDLELVHHPRPYTAFHNSNRVVADWLEELGCEIRGAALLARWRVERPRGRHASTPARRRVGPAWILSPPRCAATSRRRMPVSRSVEAVASQPAPPGPTIASGRTARSNSSAVT